MLPRVGLYALASLLLHALVLSWLDRRLEFAAPRAHDDPRLMTAAMVAPPAPTPPPAAAPRPPRAAPRPARPPRAPEPPVLADGPALSAEPAMPEPPAQAEPPPAPEPPVPAETASAAPSESAPAPEADPAAADAAQPPAVTRWPPNGRLHYTVEATQGGTQYHGVSELLWSTGDHVYRIDQSTGVNLLITTLNLQSSTSEGRVEPSGLAPLRYTEKRRNRATVATNFNRDATPATITFSASSKEFALSDGAQDRASVVFQLAGLLASQTDGTDLSGYEVTLAGTRDAQVWRFEAAGHDLVKTGLGEVRGLRYVREPRADSYESRLEIWFAQELQWFPARIRYTERNHDVVELTLDAIDLAPQQ